MPFIIYQSPQWRLRIDNWLWYKRRKATNPKIWQGGASTFGTFARLINYYQIGQLCVGKRINYGYERLIQLIHKESIRHAVNMPCLKHFMFSRLSCFSTLICILALFSKLSVVCLVLSGPKGTSFFNCSKYSRSLARLQTHKHRVSQQTSTSRKVKRHLHKQTDENLSAHPWRAETNTVPPLLWRSCFFLVLENMY